ncbi:MAG TPA: V-type ATPase subunit, partial [Treponemataceae bacterium]|nr:V-type ATPase subunit [Treponemataceae bacterium]
MMDHSAASAYVYAKASGMKADSFVGRKAQELFNARNLEDLWNLCFDEKVPLIPEVMLAKKIQKTAEDRFVSDYKMLIDCYEKPYGILIQLLRFYEYRNIKDIGAALCSGATQMPDIIDIGTFSMLDYSAWPDIAKITKDSPIAWYDRVPSWNDQKDFDCRLDIQYIKGLWKAVQELPRSEKKYTADFIQEYIVLENCVWAVRLRVYYN